MLKKIKIVLISLIIALIGLQGLAMAQGTVLPKAEKGDCDKLLSDLNVELAQGKKLSGNIDGKLGCGIVTGKMSLSMVPYYIKFFSNYLLGMVSMIALLFTVIGGFYYSAGGLIEQKERGKTYIKNAMFGMGMAFLAWTVVNVIISAITG